MRMSKRPYPGLDDHPNCYRDDWRLWQMPTEYPDGPVGVGIDRMHRLNRFVLQYGNLFVGGDHMARFNVHDFLGARRIDAPSYVRAVDGLTIDQLLDYYRIFMHEVAPVYAFLSIGLADLAKPDFDNDDFIKKLALVTGRWCSYTPTLKVIYYLPLFPVCPSMATDETRETLKYVTNERIRGFNARLKDYIDNIAPMNHGKVAVAYLDLNGPLTAPNGELREYLSDDGLHLTPDAYWRVFDQIKDVISYEAGPGGAIVPEDNLLRMISRMQALERYVLENGMLSDKQLADFSRAFGMRELSTNQKLGDLGRFLPDSDLRELAKYIVHYTNDPLDVARRFDPESLADYAARDRVVEFPGGSTHFDTDDDNGGDEQ